MFSVAKCHRKTNKPVSLPAATDTAQTIKVNKEQNSEMLAGPSLKPSRLNVMVLLTISFVAGLMLTTLGTSRNRNTRMKIRYNGVDSSLDPASVYPDQLNTSFER